ncbi:hypothetical protein AAG596_03175 [Citromicrobium bathyomarinum]|uniref:hypothetical protein n=1 Tax=Citromicrobium bathyomarinum TaxID=72174 RepID=UPI00315A11EE
MHPQFDYIFELFTLLIGLAVAEMLMGFSRILKLRARRKAGVDPTAINVRVGWLVPLLGLLVLADLGTFWSIVWTMRGVLDMRTAMIFGVLVLIGGYYLVATLVFPDEPELWPDFDAYFWQQKRWVVGGMFLINVATSAAGLALGAAVSPDEAQAAAIAANPLFLASTLMIFLNYPAFIWLTFSMGKRVCIALMLFILATQVLYAVSAWSIPGLA